MCDFVPCDRIVQRAYYEAQVALMCQTVRRMPNFCAATSSSISLYIGGPSKEDVLAASWKGSILQQTLWRLLFYEPSPSLVVVNISAQLSSYTLEISFT